MPLFRGRNIILIGAIRCGLGDFNRKHFQCSTSDNLGKYRGFNSSTESSICMIPLGGNFKMSPVKFLTKTVHLVSSITWKTKILYEKCLFNAFGNLYMRKQHTNGQEDHYL